MPTATTGRRHGSLATRAAGTGLGLVLSLGLVLIATGGSALGQADQGRTPAKKDSPLRTKPKDVTLTPSVSKAEAKPGETVTYKVSAKLNAHWHIYTYAKAQQGDGPRNTQFDFFDTAGLALAGDWTASRDPIRKKEPAFPQIDAVEFYEDEITWSIDLKVPDDATPGPRTLRCQASYQICDASKCSFPGRWTLPDVVVNVVGSNAQAAAVVATAKAVPVSDSTTTGSAQPKKKDTPAALKPKSVRWTTALDPNEAKPGQTVTYKVTAQVDPGYHIYDYVKEQPAQGPAYTQFDLFDTAGLNPAGDWTPDQPPQVKEEPAFNNMVVSFFEGSVTWSIPLKVPDSAPAGPKTVRCQAAYQICDATSCSPAGQWTLPDASLNVLKVATSVAVAPATPPAVTPKPAEITPNVAALPPPAEAPKRAVSEVEQTAQQGIIPLMIASALGGLLALVMPCVWPMVPITVNFFVKQGQKNKGKTTGLAIIYCLAIIGVFTSVGVLCSFFLSATALPRLANNPWLNFFVAGLFFAFGLSLLGLFEIRLPNFLLNASAQGESRGGLVGVMFMALTLTITSFTCTFPVVGGLLVMASTGQFFYPIIGLATFSTVLALPFFLLALSPGMLSKMPKSGDWMNAVKVVGGLIEIGAAFKFLNTAELYFVTPEDAWINAPFILTAWVVLAAVCGFYLLGFFRTDHDHEEIKIGPGRMIVGTSFLGLALFLAPALFGRPPQNPIWGRLVGLLPPDVSRLSAPTGARAARSSPRRSTPPRTTRRSRSARKNASTASGGASATRKRWSGPGPRTSPC
ncbi:MAG: protein-disulfide reductase DsbD family protein [Isosphaeraceae bacterium]